MKRVVISLSALSLLVAGGCLEPYGDRAANSTGPVYRHHFAGTAQISQGTEATTLKKVLALPESAELRTALMQEWAAAAPAFWQKEIPASAADQSALLRPLWADLFQAESVVEAYGPGPRSELALAIQLPDDRAAVWSTNLAAIAKAWGFAARRDVSVNGAQGWEANRDGAAVQCWRAGKWTVVGVAPRQARPVTAWLAAIAKDARPVPALAGALLTATADFPALSVWLPGLAQYRLPPAEFLLAGRGENVRTELKLRYSQALPLKLEPWKIPTNSIQDPLITFTAARGMAPLLSLHPGVANSGLKPLPNQFTSWAQGGMFAQTYVATPVKDVTNRIHELGKTLPAVVPNFLPDPKGQVLFVSNRTELHYSGMPYADPHLRPAIEGGQEFLLGALFPEARRSNAAPAELFAQLSRATNLVYFHWELTEPRLAHTRQLYSLYDVLQSRQNPSTNAPSQKWLNAVAPLLGNAITEVTLPSPKELALARKSHIGFTALELTTLARWLDSAGFPYTFAPPAHLPGYSNRLNAARAAGTNRAVMTNISTPVSPPARP